MTEVRVDSKEGFNTAFAGDVFVVLNTTLTEELINEGLARETVSKIQQIRKNQEFDITDRIEVLYEATPEYEKAIKGYLKFIKDETLSVSFKKGKSLVEEYDINEYKVKFKVTKSK